jgi:hypothetical protein
MSLRDHPFRIHYGPADDPLANFYIPVLSASVRYDRSAGLFSANPLVIAETDVTWMRDEFIRPEAEAQKTCGTIPSDHRSSGVRSVKGRSHDCAC